MSSTERIHKADNIPGWFSHCIKWGDVGRLQLRVFLPLVEEHQCQALVGGDHQQMLPREAMALDFQVAHVVNPSQLTAIMLGMIEGFVGFDAGQHPEYTVRLELHRATTKGDGEIKPSLGQPKSAEHTNKEPTMETMCKIGMDSVG